MSLTGPMFLDGLIVLTVAAFVAVIVLWPRLTASTPWHVGGRVGALALVNALVLLSAASQLNASYLFFSNWADLGGAFSGHLARTSLDRGWNPHQAADTAVPGVAAPVSAHPLPLTRPVSSSGMVTYVVHGALSGLTGQVLVHVPAGYRSSGPTVRYPVLEAFHGYPSEPQAWTQVFHLPRIVEHLVHAHKLRDPLIVMPEVEIPQGVDTEGVNGPAGDPQVETWLTRDVPDWVGQHFRVIADRNAWATMGDSAGGWVAAMATILHPAQYGAGIVLGGYFEPEFGRFYHPFTATSALGRRYDLVRRVTDQPPAVSMWVQTSRADPVSYGTSERFLRAVRPPMAVHTVVLQNAGHRVSVWVPLEPQALRWLGRNVQGFRP